MITEPVAITDRQAQRVQIAQDVIKQVEAGRFIARPGMYVYILDRPTQPMKGDAKELVAGKRCEVCARGAIVLAMVDRYNSLQLNGTCTLADIAAGFNERYGDFYWRGLFPDVLVIEGAFEGYCYGWEWKAIYPDPRDRMIAIMQNIIRNKGEFKIGKVS